MIDIKKKKGKNNHTPGNQGQFTENEVPDLYTWACGLIRLNHNNNKTAKRSRSRFSQNKDNK